MIKFIKKRLRAAKLYVKDARHDGGHQTHYMYFEHLFKHHCQEYVQNINCIAIEPRLEEAIKRKDVLIHPSFPKAKQNVLLLS